MYLEFFGLSVEPFAVTPDPDFLYLTPGYREALASIVYGIEQRKGFILLVGEVGTGKTTLLRASLAAIQERNTKPIYVFNAGIPFAELIKTILREPNSEASTDKLLNKLHRKLIQEYKDGNNFAVIIDEAQNMSVETLEGLRMLSNLETNKTKLLQIVLAGQPELDQKLNLHALRQVKQRIAIRATTHNLNPKQGFEYIQHRLAKAGQTELYSVFDKAALRHIVRFAKGNPRVLNMVCDNALIASYGIQKRPVPAQLAKEVIAEYAQQNDSNPKLWLWRLAPIAGLAFLAGVGATALYQSWHLTPPPISAASSNTPPSLAPAAQDSSGAKLAQPRLESYDNRVMTDKQTPQTADTSADAATPKPLPSAAPIAGNTTALTDVWYATEWLGVADDSTADPLTADPKQPAVSVSEPVPQGSPEQLAAIQPMESPPPVIRTVVKGDNLWLLCFEVYGFCDDVLLSRIKDSNPQIINTDFIAVGDQIVFPPNPLR